MATPAQNATSLMPLQGELQLVNYINSLFGGNGGYQAEQIVNPNLVSELSATDLQNLMTEYMRGQGNFMENARQQNMSGLFNTSTRNLVSNDIMAQAALKATQANTSIKNTNAQILADIAKTNATLANNMQLAKMQAGMPGQMSGGTLAAAAGLSGLGSFLDKSGLGTALNTGVNALTKSLFGGLGNWIMGGSDTKTGTPSYDQQMIQYNDQVDEELKKVQKEIADLEGTSYTSGLDIGSIGSFYSDPNYNLASSDFSGWDMPIASSNYSNYGSIPVSFDYGSSNSGWASDWQTPDIPDIGNFSYAEPTSYTTDWNFQPSYSWGSGDSWSMPSFSFSF